jgi:uncharacterized membrane protein
MSTSPETVAGSRRDSLPGDRDSVALLTSGVVSGLTLAVAFGLLALGVESFWVTFVVGFGFVLPISIGTVAWLWPDEEATGREQADGEPGAAMAELRLQYARGEIGEAEFERRARLLADHEE